MPPRIGISLVTSLLMLGLLAPAGATAQSGTVAVSGSATQQVPNDTASIGIEVAKERGSRVAALRIVSVRLRGVIAVMQEIPGVGPGDITTGRISIRKVLRGKRTLYRASEGAAAILHQPDRAGEAIDAALAAGATGTSGPRFFAGDPALAYQNTLLAAFDQARAKAAALAARADMVLGAPLSIEEGSEVVPNQPTPRSKDTSAEAAPPVKPGASTVTATVRVVFALE